MIYFQNLVVVLMSFVDEDTEGTERGSRKVKTGIFDLEFFKLKKLLGRQRADVTSGH